MKNLLLTILSIFCLCSQAWGADYTAYFADDGTDDIVGTWDASECTEGDPCNTLAEAQKVIDDVESTDTVTLYFKYGDEWNTADTGAQSTTLVYGLTIDSSDPTVYIDAYGTAEDGRPIFNGQEDDFENTNSHNSTTGPLMWSRIFDIDKASCKISNIEIKNVYGIGIYLQVNANGFTLENCNIHDIGSDVLRPDANTTAISNCIVQNNLIYNCQLLNYYEKIPAHWWSGGITFINLAGNNFSNNIVRHNVIYNISGEGIINPNGTTEYNVVGDTYSVAIDTAPQSFDEGETIIRYNLIFGTSAGTFGRATAMRIFDEAIGGTNSNGDIQIYGNVIINRARAIKQSCDDVGGNECNQHGSVKIYNNTAIDCGTWSSNPDYITKAFEIINPSDVAHGYFYNNASIHYDRDSVPHTTDSSHANWTYANNAFYPVDATNTVGTGFTTDYVTGDPKILGEAIPIAWITDSTDFFLNTLDFDIHLYLDPTSALINAGKDLTTETLTEYDDDFLTYGTDFGVLPDTETFSLADQDDKGSGWEIGAIVYLGDEEDNPPANNVCTDAIAHWIFDDNSLDSTANDNDLTDSGSPTHNGDGIVLNGTDQYAYLAALSSNLETFTIFCNFKLTDSPGDGEVFMIVGEWDGDTPNKNFALGTYGSGGSDYFILWVGHADDNDHDLLISSYALQQDTQYCVTATYDSVNDDAHIYVYEIDGTERGDDDDESLLDEDSINTEDEYLRMGAYQDGAASVGGFFEGVIYEIAIYGSEKSKADALAFATSQYSDASEPIVETVKRACSSLTSAGDLTFAIAWDQRVITQTDVWTVGITFDYPTTEQTATYSGRWNEESGWTNSTGTIYYKTTYTEPTVVKRDGVNGTTLTESDGNYGTLTSNQWDWVDWNGTTAPRLYVNVGSDPSDDEIVPTPYETYITIACLAGWRQNDFDDAEFSASITKVGSCTIKNQSGDDATVTNVLDSLDEADYPSTDVTVAIPGTFTLGTNGTFPLWSDESTGFHDAAYDIDGDTFWVMPDGFTDDVVISADSVVMRGYGRCSHVTGALTFDGDDSYVGCVLFSDGCTDNGSNIYHPVCQRGRSRMGMNPR